MSGDAQIEIEATEDEVVEELPTDDGAKIPTSW